MICDPTIAKPVRSGAISTPIQVGFPGDEFLNFYAFFLDSLDKRRLAILGIQTARMMMERMILEQELKIQNGSSGQESFIDYQERWDAVWKELQNSHM